MFESKYASILTVAVVLTGTDAIKKGMFQCVQADNPKAVMDAIQDLLERMPKDGTCELSVWYNVAD